MLYQLAKKHADMKAAMAKEKKPALEVEIGLGKGKDLPETPAEESADLEAPPSEEELPMLGDEGEEGNPDAAEDEMLIRKIVAEMLDERLGKK